MAIREKPRSCRRLAVPTALALLACWAPGAAAYSIPAATGQGDRALVATDEQLLPALDTDASVDVYERSGGELSLLSGGEAACLPVCGNGAFDVETEGGLWPFGADGLVFTTAEPLVGDDTDASVDVYERSGESLQLISRGPNGFNDAHDAEVFAIDESSGSRVVFTTDEQLVAGDTDESVDVYERSGSTTTLLSQGAQFNGEFDAEPAAASDDASAVDILTGEQLAAEDTDSSIDLYKSEGGTTQLLSKGTGEFNGPHDVDPHVVISADGSRTAFSTDEALMPQDDDEAKDVYTRFLTVTSLRTVGPYDPYQGENPAQLEAMHPVANIILFTTQRAYVEHDRDFTGLDIYERFYVDTRLISQSPIQPFLPEPIPVEFLDYATSPFGGDIYFSTTERMAVDDTDELADIYVRSDEETDLVSRGQTGGNGAHVATLGQVAADGHRAFFTTRERLVAEDTDESIDLYERSNSNTDLVSAGEVNGNGPYDVTDRGGIDRPHFTTDEPLVPGDLDSEPDLYTRYDGVTRLLSTPKPDPAAPGIDGTDPPSPSNVATIRVRGTADALSTVDLFLGGGCGGAPAAGGSGEAFASPGLTLQVPENGVATIRARARDPNNNTGPCSAPFSYIEDSTPLPPPLLTGVSPSGPSQSTRPSVRGSAAPDGAVAVYANPICGGAPSAGGSPLELSVGIQVPVPTNRTTAFSATVTDLAGNVSGCSSGHVEYAQDSAPPQTRIVRGPKRKTRNRTPTFSIGVSEPYSDLDCRLDGKPARRCHNLFTTRHLKPGRHRVSFAATDLAGNVDPTPAVRRFRIVKKKRRRRAHRTRHNHRSH